VKTIKQVAFIKVVQVETMPPKKDMEQFVLYVSKKYGLSIHLCLCGECGEQTVLPFSHIIEGKDIGWTHEEDAQGRYTIRPSVGNFQMPCKSHYIITNNIANFV
jgi:hypothetical protein